LPADRPAAPPGQIVLAAITGAHGVAGEVRLKLLGEGLESLKAHASFNDGALRMKKLRDDGKGGAIARFEGVSSRDQAEALRGTQLSVARDALPPLEDGEFYHADLIGLAVITDGGEPVGTVVDVQNFGASDVIEIEKADGRKFMAPLTQTAVPEWNDARLILLADFVQ
jgi:16S rRNA processing protein RimM